MHHLEYLALPFQQSNFCSKFHFVEALKLYLPLVGELVESLHRHRCRLDNRKQIDSHCNQQREGLKKQLKLWVYF